MSPDPSGVAAPEDPAAAPGGGAERPRFKPGVERVDETTIDFPDHPSAAPDRGRRPLAAEAEAPRSRRRGPRRARKVRRIVRHIEPWSVLKISVLFFMSVFLIICVASTVLWNAARTAGAIDDVESFVTSLGFGNCEDIPGQVPPAPTTASPVPGAEGASTTVTVAPATDGTSTLPNKDGECAEGQRLVGGFKFDDQRIFQAFALGGVVLVLAGSATTVVMALLFNLLSDLTGGVRVTVLEEEPVPRSARRSGSPGRRGRG